MASSFNLFVDTLCIACREFREKSFYFVKPKDPKSWSNQSWGKWSSRQLDEVRNNVLCPLCRLVYQSLSRNNPAPSTPLGNIRIHYYRLLFGAYEGPESVKNLIGVPETTNDPMGLWNLYQTHRLQISINPYILYRGGPGIARGLDRKSLQYSSSGGGVAVDIGVKGYDPSPSVDIHMGVKGHDENEVTFVLFEDSFLHGQQTNEQLDFDLASSWSMRVYKSMVKNA